MTTPTHVFIEIAQRYGGIDPSDTEAVQSWFTEELPSLPRDEIEEILEELMNHEGDDPIPGEIYIHPRNAPLPTLEDSPAVRFSVAKLLIRALAGKFRL